MDKIKHFKAPKTVYISGKITGDSDYRVKFARIEVMLLNRGFSVMNPAILPDGFLYEDYMDICFSMLKPCEAIYMMSCWRDSAGAKQELKKAMDAGILIMGHYP